MNHSPEQSGMIKRKKEKVCKCKSGDTKIEEERVCYCKSGGTKKEEQRQIQRVCYCKEPQPPLIRNLMQSERARGNHYADLSLLHKMNKMMKIKKMKLKMMMKMKIKMNLHKVLCMKGGPLGFGRLSTTIFSTILSTNY